MTTGVGVFCVVCDARPYPELGPPDTREEFDLIGLDCKGRPAESPASGEWSVRGISSAVVAAAIRSAAER
jgi:hypothetical protein